MPTEHQLKLADKMVEEITRYCHESTICNWQRIMSACVKYETERKEQTNVQA